MKPDLLNYEFSDKKSINFHIQTLIRENLKIITNAQ